MPHSDSPHAHQLASNVKRDSTISGVVLPLSHFLGPVSVAESIALTDARVRTHVSYAIAGTFMLANFLTLAGAAYIFHEDNANVAAKIVGTGDRVITSGVVMAIIAATTIQLGTLALTMGKYLYPARSRASPPVEE